MSKAGEPQGALQMRPEEGPGQAGARTRPLTCSRSPTETHTHMEANSERHQTPSVSPAETSRVQPGCGGGDAVVSRHQGHGSHLPLTPLIARGTQLQTVQHRAEKAWGAGPSKPPFSTQCTGRKLRHRDGGHL